MNNSNQKIDQIIERIKELVAKGNINRIQITKNGDTILNVPLNVGILGVALAPWAMIVATLVTIGTDCEINLVTKDNETINVDTTDLDKKD